MGILLSEDPSFAGKLQVLSPDEMLQIIAQPLSDALVRVESDPAEGEGLASMMSAIPSDMLVMLFEELDRWRVGSGIAASVAYEALLRSSSLSMLFPKIVEALQKQGDEDAVQLLDSIRAELTDRTQQRLCKVRFCGCGRGFSTDKSPVQPMLRAIFQAAIRLAVL